MEGPMWQRIAKRFGIKLARLLLLHLCLKAKRPSFCLHFSWSNQFKTLYI